MLKIGMEINLELEENGKMMKLRTKIADLDGKNIYIHYPADVNTKKTFFLPIDQFLHIYFTLEDKSAFTFSTVVTGRVKKKVPLLVLEKPKAENIQRIQRRQFVRIDTAIDVAVHFPNFRFTTLTADFSAGGCSIILPNQFILEKGDVGKVYIVMPMKSRDHIYVKLKSEVVRVLKGETPPVASLKFLDVDKKSQQQLVRFCFEKQIELRNKQVPHY